VWLILTYPLAPRTESYDSKIVRPIPFFCIIPKVFRAVYRLSRERGSPRASERASL
jgi:hypothetical protein